jgi:hypothetical protein
VDISINDNSDLTSRFRLAEKNKNNSDVVSISGLDNDTFPAKKGSTPSVMNVRASDNAKIFNVYRKIITLHFFIQDLDHPINVTHTYDWNSYVKVVKRPPPSCFQDIA